MAAKRLSPSIRRGVRAAALLLLLLIGLTACTPVPAAVPAAAPASGLAVAVLSSDLAAGPARLMLAVRNRTGNLLHDGPLHLRLTLLPAAEAPALEAAAVPRPSGIPGVATYEAAVNFPQAGTWQVQVEAPSGNPARPLTGSALAEVSSTPAAPSAGAPAPPLAAPEFAADAGQGKPVVITFAVPSLCPGGACAAQLAVLHELRQRYGERLHIIHLDPVQDTAANGELPAYVQLWNLRTQPWTFVVDGGGIITAQFEGFVGLEELENAVAGVLTP